MRRREFIALIGSAAAVSFLLVPVARAQEPGRIYKLGVIAGPAVRHYAHLQALQSAARARGVEVAVFSTGTPELIAPTIYSPSIAGSSSSGPLHWVCPRFLAGPKWRKRVV